MNESIWAGKRVLITGHTGFKGSWLTLWLAALGARVTGLSLAPSSDPNLFALARVESVCTSIIGDICDPASVADVFARAEPDVVFHLAAQSIVRLSFEDPVGTYMTNVMGTARILDAVRVAPSVRAIVMVSSDKCYENHETIWGCREYDAMGGYDPYSSSKGCMELVTSAFRRSFFGVPGAAGLASARAGNVIGGGDWARDRLIPDVVRGVRAGVPALIRNPDAVRPWQHVLEPLSGYCLLAEKLLDAPKIYSEGWNFGPDQTDQRSVAAVLAEFCKGLQCGAEWQVQSSDSNPHEAKQLRLDITKARVQLGWQPRWSLAEGIAATAEWYRRWFGGEDMQRVCLDQISAYERAA